MQARADDEFDAWLTKGPEVAPGSSSAAGEPTPAAAALSSWFSGSSSLFGATGSSLLGSAAKHLEDSASFLSSQAQEVASTVQQQAEALPVSLPSDGWAALDGVKSKIKATIDEQVSAYNQEASKYCTEEAVEKERDELRQAVQNVGVHVVHSVGIAPPSGLETPAPADSEAEFVAIADAPAHLKDRLKEALLALSASESTFTTAAPELPALASSGHELHAHVDGELAALRQSAKSALAMDENLRLMRFHLVPAHVKEEAFWHNYFMRVLRERRIFQLPPIEAPQAGHGAAAEPAKDASAETAKDAAAKDTTDSVSSAQGSTLSGQSAARPAMAERDARPPAVHSTDLQEAEAEADTWLQLAATPAAAAPATKVTRPSSLEPPSCSSEAKKETKQEAKSESKEGGAVVESSISASATPATLGLPPPACNKPSGDATQTATAPASEAAAPTEQAQCSSEELEAKIAAELGMDDDEEDEEGLINLELVSANELDAMLADDDDDALA